MKTGLFEWILMAGFVFLMVWPFVVMDFGLWALANLVVVVLVAWAYRAAPHDSRAKSLFGGPPREVEVQAREGSRQ